MKFFSKTIQSAQHQLSALRNEFSAVEKSIDQKILRAVTYGEKLKQEKEAISELSENLKELYNNAFGSTEWLAKKYAEFYFLIDEKSYVYPSKRKSANCVEAQKAFANENKNLRNRIIELELQLNQIESLIPDVEEIIDTTHEDKYLENTEIETREKVDLLVAIDEQEVLSETQILQKALDRYINRKMSKSAVGKDYERYIGHLYEKEGYKVEYHGIKKGFLDLGIDLICKKAGETLLIQCKYWKKQRSIHENAINQLFGTSMKYYLDKTEKSKQDLKGSLFENIGIPFSKEVQPVFITTTQLSETAMEFAKVLKIKVLTIPYEKEYPRIKCNNGKDAQGKPTRIFHLPFDQKYDITQNISNGGVNVSTIQEAVDLKYRKAFKWCGE